MTDGLGNAAQTRAVAEQVAEAAIAKFLLEHPPRPPKEMPIPAPIKWAAGIVSGVFVALLTSGCIWMVVTLSDMKSQFARITAQLEQNGAIDLRFAEVNRRVDRLETYHAKGPDK